MSNADVLGWSRVGQNNEKIRKYRQRAGSVQVQPPSHTSRESSMMIERDSVYEFFFRKMLHITSYVKKYQTSGQLYKFFGLLFTSASSLEIDFGTSALGPRPPAINW